MADEESKSKKHKLCKSPKKKFQECIIHREKCPKEAKIKTRFSDHAFKKVKSARFVYLCILCSV